MNIIEIIKAAAYGALGVCAASLLFWLIIIPIKEHEARKGYVIEARATAAEAKAAELQRQLTAGQLVISSYQEIAKNDRARDEKVAADTETRIADYEKRLQTAGRSCLLDPDDIRMLQSQ